MAAPLRKSSGSPVFSGVAPSLSSSWARLTVSWVLAGAVRMLLPVAEKVSGTLAGDQIFARGEEKRTLLAAFGVGLVSDHEDANLVGGSGEDMYGREGFEKGEDVVSVWACWLSPSPVPSVFCPFPRFMGSSGADDSGTYGMSACEDSAVVAPVSMGWSPVGWESGTWATGVVGFGVGW